MKKTSRPASKKPAQKKPVANQSSKPKRKGLGQPKLAQVVDPLDSIMDKLTELLGAWLIRQHSRRMRRRHHRRTPNSG